MSIENPYLSSAKEKPLKQAGWAARLIYTRNDVDKKNFKIFVDPEDQGNEIVSFQMWMPSLSADKRGGSYVNLLCFSSLSSKDQKWESVIVDLKLPTSLQHQELPHFCEEATEGWRRFVDKELLPKKLKADWRVLQGVEEEEQVWLDEGNLVTGEEDEQVHLSFEDLWDSYDPEDYGNNSKEEYVNLVLDAFSRSYDPVTKFLESFNKQEIPRLVKERERRTEIKPTGWLGQVMKKRKDIQNIKHCWSIPERGIEPDTQLAGGQIIMKDKTEYYFFVKAKDIQDKEESGYCSVEFLIFLPDEIQSVFHQRKMNFEDFAERLQKFLEDNRAIDKVIVFDIKQALVYEYFHLYRITVRKDPSKQSLLGLGVELCGVDTQQLHKAGYNNEWIIDRVFETLVSLHPHVKSFADTLKA